MNDKKLNPREPEIALSGEEESALLGLLRSAYPNPPPGMTGRIMERIREDSRADSRADGREASGKILPAADSRKPPRRGAWIRWSALAASILLVGTLGLTVLPRLTQNLKTAPAADSAMPEFQASASDSVTGGADAAVTEDAAEEIFSEEDASIEAPAEAEEGSFFAMELPAAPEPAPAPAPDPSYTEEKSAVTAAADAPTSEPQDAPASANGPVSAPAAPADEEAVAEPESADFLRSAVLDLDGAEDDAFGFDSGEVEAGEGLLSMKLYTLNGAVGISAEEGEIPMMTSGTRNSAYTESAPRDMLTYYYVRTACAHADAFRNSYHDIPEVLIAKVGPELYGAWATKVQNEDLCGVNILSFAVRFGLSAEDIYSTGDTWYFLDLPENIPLTEENAGAVEQYYLDGGDPGKMIPRVTVYNLKTAMIREAGMDAYLAWRGDGDKSLVSWSVAEGASALGLSDETLNRLCGEALEKTAADYGTEFLPDRETVLNG